MEIITLPYVFPTQTNGKFLSLLTHTYTHTHIAHIFVRQASIQKIKAKIALLQEEEAKANTGTQVEDDDEDDDDDDDDDDEEDVIKSPIKSPVSKKKRTIAPADARLATQLLEQRMVEEEMLEKTEEVLQKLIAKVLIVRECMLSQSSRQLLYFLSVCALFFMCRISLWIRTDLASCLDFVVDSN
jgi:hypothetical protein